MADVKSALDEKKRKLLELKQKREERSKMEQKVYYFFTSHSLIPSDKS